MKKSLTVVLFVMAFFASSAFAYVRYIYPDGNYCDVPPGYEDQFPPDDVQYVGWGYPAYGYPIWPIWFNYYSWWGGGWGRGYYHGGWHHEGEGFRENGRGWNRGNAGFHSNAGFHGNAGGHGGAGPHANAGFHGGGGVQGRPMGAARLASRAVAAHGGGWR